MTRASGDDHRLGGAVAGADDKIVRIQIELFDGEGKQREVFAVEPAGEWQPLDGGSPDDPFLDHFRGGSGNVDERKQVRGREQLAEDFEGFLASAKPGEPVVDQGDTHQLIIADSGVGFLQLDLFRGVNAI